MEINANEKFLEFAKKLMKEVQSVAKAEGVKNTEIMLDEAFDKMDDDRIENMMKFLRSQNFQIILATPPAKIETIGEYVDTVLVTYRNGYSSIVEEYGADSPLKAGKFVKTLRDAMDC